MEVYKDSLTLRRPFDGHLHLRQWTRLFAVIAWTARVFSRAIIMPNLSKNPENGPLDFQHGAILNGEGVSWYEKHIEQALDMFSIKGFTPLVTFKITDQTTVDDVDTAYAAGARVAKVYPHGEGLTTNSAQGVSFSGWKNLDAIWKRCAERGIRIAIHGEDSRSETFCLDREKVFLSTLKWLNETYPDLYISLEHITTKEAVDMVMQLSDKVVATITIHHLMITLEDVVGGMLKPHNFCKPIAKRPEDRDALLKAAFSGNPKFFFGSDSAPHRDHTKECASGCAGIYSAPVCVQLLVELFEQNDQLEKLEGFLCEFGPAFYGIKPSDETISLVRKNWLIPESINEFRPFRAGMELSWQVDLPEFHDLVA